MGAPPDFDSWYEEQHPLVLAALMIPGGKLTDRYGRKRCFTVSLVAYGIGALLSAVAPGLGVHILGKLDPGGCRH